MQLRLYNTLTRKKEDFVPLMKDPNYAGQKKDFIGIYSCGPTVYSTPHIGNFKATFVADLIRNILKHVLGYHVKAVMNITDVGHLSGDNEGDADHGEDRLEKGAKKEGITARDVAKKYEKLFMEGLEKLNIDRFDVMPRATEHIQEQIALVKILEEKGYTYAIENDGVYIDTSKIDDYGKLMGPNYKKRLDGLQAGFRVEDTGKKNPSDFALWKFSPKDRKRDMERPSPRGIGFPGWHIECSAMSSKYLGEQFDIHHGGPEHITIHHTDEIAQSECAFGKKPWVKYWLHHGLLTVDGGKMGKSLGNTYSLQDLQERGFSLLDLRMFYLQAQYRTTQDFTFTNLESAKNTRINMIKKVKEIGVENYDLDKIEEKVKKVLLKTKREDCNNEEIDFRLFINGEKGEGVLLDDLNTPLMLGYIHVALNTMKKNCNNMGLDLLYWLEQKVLKIGLFDFSQIEDKIVDFIPDNIVKMAQDRQDAKTKKDYKLADELRNQIKDFGFEVKDNKDGYEIVKI